MPKKELVDYIEAELAKGNSVEATANKLLQVGWSEPDITAAFDYLFPHATESTAPVPPPAHIPTSPSVFTPPAQPMATTSKFTTLEFTLLTFIVTISVELITSLAFHFFGYYVLGSVVFLPVLVLTGIVYLSYGVLSFVLFKHAHQSENRRTAKLCYVAAILLAGKSLVQIWSLVLSTLMGLAY
ncbi:MAG: hypothetical protein KC877_00500 [Candidatus Kaiserbacteria bacterium]|nr:hypothetical protein [Candidatus Kaiserbacteria bacterium]MCB9816031.1 hypothetical protein [Candidatus Nomurabacteria bacterium]